MKVLNQSHPSGAEMWEGDVPHLSQGWPRAAQAACCAHRADSQELNPVIHNAPHCHSDRFSLLSSCLHSDVVKSSVSFVVRDVWSPAHKSIVNPALSRKCLLPYPGASGQRTERVEAMLRSSSKPCKSPQITKQGTSVDKGWVWGECFSEPGGRRASSQGVGMSKGTPEVHPGWAGPVSSSGWLKVFSISLERKTHR